MSKKKLAHVVRFPLRVNLQPYMSQSANGKTEIITTLKSLSVCETSYELVALLLHRGPSANAGHYIAHTFSDTVCLFVVFVFSYADTKMD